MDFHFHAPFLFVSCLLESEIILRVEVRDVFHHLLDARHLAGRYLTVLHVRLLAPEVIRKIENLFINQESYTWQGHLRDPYLLGAFLAWHYDDSLSDEDCKTLANFLDPYSIAEETDMVHRPGVPVKKDPESGLWMPDEDAINAAATIIAASMERLK